MLDDTSYEVNIGENEQVIEVEITDEYIHGNIELTKVDADYPDNKLTGATFEVYKDVNGCLLYTSILGVQNEALCAMSEGVNS